jgi:exonuclease VII small subunit
MNSANQQRPDAARAGEELASQYHSFIDEWAQVSKCCLEAADDIYQTGIDYVREQAEQLQEITRDPSAAMREQTYSRVINCSFDAADRIAQAYIHSLETVREPLTKAVCAQLPMGRSMTQLMESSLERGAQAMEQGTERMERGLRGATRAAEQGAQRGAEESRSQQHHPQHHQGKRKSA